MAKYIHTDLVLDKEGDPDSFFSLHYIFDNGNGCAAMKEVSFVGKPFAAVREFVEGLRGELSECRGGSLALSLWRGRGMNAKRASLDTGETIDTPVEAEQSYYAEFLLDGEYRWTGLKDACVANAVLHILNWARFHGLPCEVLRVSDGIGLEAFYGFPRNEEAR